MDIAHRIMRARKNKGLSQTQIALMVGVSRGACGQWERGIAVPSINNLSRLALLLEVRFEWLTTGRGEMLYDANIQEPGTTYDQAKAFMSDDQKEVVRIYSSLSAKRKSALLEFLRTL